MRRSTYDATKLWRAELRVEWDGRRGHDIERTRVEVANGAVVDIENAPAKDDFLRLKLTAHGIFQPTPCQGGPVTNIVGAGWTSTHDPADASDHLPYVEEGVLSQPRGPLCPVYTNTVVHAGWTHNTEILWIRNLVRILTGDPWDDETDHCIALQYDSGGTIDLFDYLSDVCTSYRNDFVFKVNGQPISGHIISMWDYATDNDLKPSVLHVCLSYNNLPELDRMWIILYAASLKNGYDTWKTTFSSVAWTSVLPAVHTCIGLVTNASGRVSVDESKVYPGWNMPAAISSYLHHDAAYEMRSEAVGDHGHQATYSEDGTLIRTTIAAGTADYNHPLSFGMSWGSVVVEKHYVNDVVPFLRAISLDGNPGVYSGRYIPKNLTRPCLYQGTNLSEYILRRPTLPTGTTP